MVLHVECYLGRYLWLFENTGASLIGISGQRAARYLRGAGAGWFRGGPDMNHGE